ncbi:MAG: hypothetical protein LBO82_03890 [Synergistaceae bacterium]|jgi:hypothetical protein|nr:hypothetical protein [Synergistaceae bacterium]
MSAQRQDRIRYEGNDYGLAAAPLEPYFAARPELRPKFRTFDTGCMRGYIARWEIRGERLYLTGMDMVCETDATFASLFPEAGGEGIFASWVGGDLVCPRGKLLKYDHAGFGGQTESELILSLENGVLKSVRTKNNTPKQSPQP